MRCAQDLALYVLFVTEGGCCQSMMTDSCCYVCKSLRGTVCPFRYNRENSSCVV